MLNLVDPPDDCSHFILGSRHSGTDRLSSQLLACRTIITAAASGRRGRPGSRPADRPPLFRPSSQKRPGSPSAHRPAAFLLEPFQPPRCTVASAAFIPASWPDSRPFSTARWRERLVVSTSWWRASGSAWARLVRHRISLVMTQPESARRVGMDPGTPARWERGERKPIGTFTALVRAYLAR